MIPPPNTNNRKIEEIIEESEEESAKLRATRARLPYLDLALAPIAPEALTLIPENDARGALMAILTKEGRTLNIALHDPALAKTKEILARLRQEGFRISLFLVSKRSIEKAWGMYPKMPETHTQEEGVLTVEKDILEYTGHSVKTFADFGKVLANAAREKNTSRLITTILALGFVTDASDVHFEPGENEVFVRLRIDGVLHDTTTLTWRTYDLILSRVKLLASLKLNIHTNAQEGRFSVNAPDGKEFGVRASVIPAARKESVVLRILNPRSLISLTDLGMRRDFEKTVIQELEKPSGMILVTGPSGSGKTTTHFAFLKHLARRSVKIITIEDPIEYHLDGVTQTEMETEKGYTFANALKSILRQDPDIILVGEIRDGETANVVLEAALTGHLVLSTLHTNDAPGVIPRLLELNVDLPNLASALNLAIAQRLVRKLCTACKTMRSPTEEERRYIKEELLMLPLRLQPKTAIRDIQIPHAPGCSVCFGSGYKGRVGIFEMFQIDKAVRDAMMDASRERIERTGRRARKETMRQDGILKVLNGITTLEELDRVLGQKER